MSPTGSGLVTLLVAALSAASVLDDTLVSAVGDSAPVLIVLGSVVIGGVTGSLLGIEQRLERVGGALQQRLTRSGRSREAGLRTTTADAHDIARARFVEGYVTASLIFCVGPLTILGALSDGLGRGIDQLALKSVLDGFAAIAFAASFGWGVAASVVTIVAVQGSLTVVGILLGDVLPDAHIAALTATGGLLLAGVGLRLLQIKPLPVGDLLPALIVAPLLVETVIALR